MRRYIKARLVLLLTALVAGLADIGSVKIMEPVHLTPVGLLNVTLCGPGTNLGLFLVGLIATLAIPLEGNSRHSDPATRTGLLPALTYSEGGDYRADLAMEAARKKVDVVKIIYHGLNTLLLACGDVEANPGPTRTVQILWGRRKFSINIPTRATSTDLCQALQRQTPRDMTEFMLKPQGGRGYIPDNTIIDNLTHFEVIKKEEIGSDVFKFTNEDVVNFQMESLLTPEEVVMEGLCSGVSNPNLLVKKIPGKGRGVVATNDIPTGTFICEYRTDIPPYPRKKRPAMEAEYTYNSEGSYTFDVQCRDGPWVTFDATRHTQQYGRYLNHASAPVANVKPLHPFLVDGRLRLGFISLRHINANEELTWDYGIPPQGASWLKKSKHSDKDLGKETESQVVATDPTATEAVTTSIPFQETTDSTATTPMESTAVEPRQTTPGEVVQELGAVYSQPVNTEATAMEPGRDLESTAELSISHSEMVQEQTALHSELALGSTVEIPITPSEVVQESGAVFSELESKAAEPGRTTPSEVVQEPETLHSQPEVAAVEPGLDLDKTAKHTVAVSPPTLAMSKKKITEDREMGECKFCEQAIPLSCLDLHTAACLDEQLREEGALEYSDPEVNSMTDYFTLEPSKFEHDESAPQAEQGDIPSTSGGVTVELPPFRGSWNIGYSDTSGAESDVEDSDVMEWGGELAEDSDIIEWGGQPAEDSDVVECGDQSAEESDIMECGSEPAENRKHRRTSMRMRSQQKRLKADSDTTARGEKDSKKDSEVLALASGADSDKETDVITLESGGDDKVEDTDVATSVCSDSSENLKRRKIAEKGKGKMRRRRKGKGGRNRRIKACPIAGCTAKSQIKLADHIRLYHTHISQKERRRLTRVAKVVGMTKAKTETKTVAPAGMTPLPRLFKKCIQEEEQPPAGLIIQPSVEPGKAGTRHFSRFPLDHAQIQPFVAFLESMDGRCKSTSEAKAIATDVSKYLRFVSPKVTWQLMMDTKLLKRYVDHLKESGIGVEGILTKLDRMVYGIRYLRLEVSSSDDARTAHLCETAEKRVAQWRAALRPQKALKQKLRLEDASNEPGSLSTATALLTHEPMWNEVREILSRSLYEEIELRKQKVVTAALLSMVVCRNWQRPGAVANALLSELKSATMEGDVFVMRVAQHKTARQGPARLTLTTTEMKLIKKYVHRIRPMLDPDQIRDEIFLKPGPKRITNIDQQLKKVGKHFKVTVTTCTQLRKLGATAVATECTHGETVVVAKQMSHSPATAAKYYELVQSKAAAVQAHHIRERVMAEAREVTEEQQGSSTSPSLRQAYTEQEEEAIRKFFKKFIKSGKTPPAAICATFLSLNKYINRTKKQIQDKIRAINSRR